MLKSMCWCNYYYCLLRHCITVHCTRRFIAGFSGHWQHMPCSLSTNTPIPVLIRYIFYMYRLLLLAAISAITKSGTVDTNYYTSISDNIFCLLLSVTDCSWVLCLHIFTARSSYASAVLEIVILTVSLSVRHTRALWQKERTYCRFDTA